MRLVTVLLAAGFLRLVLEGCSPAHAASPAQVSTVVGELRVIFAQSSTGPAAMTVSKLDGSRTGYYYDLGERAGELRPKAKKVVLLGLGGGEMLRAARRSLPRAELLGIDNDARMLRAAREEFRIGDFGARGMEYDAFKYVRLVRGAELDVMLVDLFVGDKMPQPMLEAGFWRDCRAALAKKGLVAVNVYPASLLPLFDRLLAGAGFRELERHEVQGSTVVFVEPRT
jgi:spermidine synthase